MVNFCNGEHPVPNLRTFSSTAAAAPSLLLLLRSDPRVGAGGLSLALSSALSLLPKKKSEEDALSLRAMAKIDPAAPNATTPPTLNHVDLLDEEEEKEEVAFSFKSGDASSCCRLLWFMTCFAFE